MDFLDKIKLGIADLLLDGAADVSGQFSGMVLTES